MREKIKAVFIQSGHQFVSGEEISKQFSISRTAVWKHIEELKKEGYQFEAIRKKGYRLMNDPDDISPDQIKVGLSTKWLGQEIVYMPEVDSTQRIAHELARKGAAHGTIVLADKQTKGKGRLGRSWYSEKGKGIWMSIIVRPTFPYHQAPQITLLTSIIIAETLRSIYGDRFDIKWPNDIYVEGKKVSGILTEMHGEQDRIHYLIIGIGINTLTPNFPNDLSQKATSIQEIIEQAPKRIELLQRLFEHFEKEYGQFLIKGFDPYFERYNELLYGKGKQITVQQLNQQLEGTIEGIDLNGFLILKKDDSTEVKVVSGDIYF